MEPTATSEQAYYAVATPHAVELWKSHSRPRVTVSKVRTSCHRRAYRGGRYRTIKEPTELIKYTVRSKGTCLRRIPMNTIHYVLLTSLLPRWRVKLAGIYSTRLPVKGERYLCVKLSNQEVITRLLLAGEAERRNA